MKNKSDGYIDAVDKIGTGVESKAILIMLHQLVKTDQRK